MDSYLKDFLLRNKKDEKCISNRLLEELKMVESEILKRKELIVKAEELIKVNSINVKAISEATGISRKTFYNNELLLKMVAENTTEDKVSREEIKKLKQKLIESDKTILKFVEKDIETEVLRNQFNKVKNELDNAYRRIKSLEEQHEKDIKKQNKKIVGTDTNMMS